jgi:O-antigen/teichoic acid export membrane protein
MGYTGRAVSGFGWQTGLKVLGSAVVLAKMFVLARLLTPTEFGLFSLTTIALGVSEALTETGINITLLQTKNSIEHYLDTAWVIAIIRGMIIGCIMVLMGVGMSDFFNQSQLLSLVGFAALVPVIKGLINPAIITFHKNLNFVADSAYRLSLIVVEGVLAVVCVWIYPSVLSLIAALILSGIFEVGLSFALFKVWPQFKYVSSRAAHIFANARWLSLSSLFSYLNENMDNILLGKTVGAYGLGLYQNAYALAHKTNYDFAKSIHHSTLPIYTKMSDDVGRLRRAFSRTMMITLLIAGGASLPLLIGPEFMVNLILGPQWLAASHLVRWLVLAGCLQAIAMVGYSVLLARNSLRLMNVHQLVSFVGLVTLVWWGSSQSGLSGAVMGLAISRLIALPVLILGLARELRRS